MLKLLVPLATLITMSAFGVAEAARPGDGAGAPASPTLLAVFAHPDDETFSGHMLARYARRGADVHMVVATSGQLGFTPHSGVPTGDALGQLREREAECSRKALDLKGLHLVGLADQGLTGFTGLERFRFALREYVRLVRPGVIVTWGPEGVSGHIDHRVVSLLTTQVFQEASDMPSPPKKLYHLAWPTSKRPARTPRWPPDGFSKQPFTVDDALITTVVDSREGLPALRRSAECHRSQFDGGMVADAMLAIGDTLGGRVYLRLAMSRVPAPKAQETDLFEGL